MTKPDLEAILDECLHCMSTRGESIERCLQRYPQHAGQLTPLIQVADHIRKTSHPKLSASATKAIERRLLKRATELRPSRAQTGLWPFPSSLRPLVTAAATLMVILALVLAGGGGIVYASTDSLPGSPLYGVKRATEEVQLFLAPTGTRRAELHINFAQRRLEEVQALAQAKGKVDEETLAAIAEETDLALEEVEGVHPADKSDLLEKLASLTERQQAVLKGVQAKAPEAAQEGLNRALEASQQGHERAREALEKEKPGRDVKPTKTPKPTPTPKPAKTPKPTHVPGEHGQGQEPPSAPPGQGHGPPAEPPGQSDKDHGPPAEPPGQSDKEQGPPAEPPGQSDKDQGPPAEPQGQSGGETLHPVASALGKFFTDALGLDYDEIMGYHEDGMGFDAIAQACWMSTMLEGKVKAGDILAAKKSGDFSFIDPELLGGGTPTNWSQFRKAILSSEKVQKNLGAITSGRAGMDQKQQTATGNQGQGKGKQGQGLEEDGTSPESPGKGKGGGPTAEPPGQGKDKDKGNDKEKSK
jgi:hypothetical protein